MGEGRLMSFPSLYCGTTTEPLPAWHECLQAARQAPVFRTGKRQTRKRPDPPLDSGAEAPDKPDARAPPKRQTALTSLVRPENGPGETGTFPVCFKATPPHTSPHLTQTKRLAARSRLPVPGHKPAATGVRHSPMQTSGGRRPTWLCGPPARPHEPHHVLLAAVFFP